MNLQPLHDRFPWPASAPELPENWHGWLRDRTAVALSERISQQTCLVVECGTWLGLSARHILHAAPRATVICIDHWLGGPDNQAGEEAVLLPNLYDQCQRNLWPWRDRVILMRSDTLPGLRDVAAIGVRPDMVYVDSMHRYHHVAAELAIIETFWPGVTIVGDDPWIEEVARAAREHAVRHHRRVQWLEHCYAFDS